MEWLSFLHSWEQDMLAILQQFARIGALSEEDRVLLQRGTLRFSDAQAWQIAELEQQLEVVLPPSYRSFLQATNGWVQVAMDVGNGKIWSTTQVQWFRVQEPQWLEAWSDDDYAISDEDYFKYGEDQDIVAIRREYLHTALAISQGIDSSIYLLNPKAVSETGEWEAWWFGNKIAGAKRYPSFEVLMVAERERVRANLLDALAYCQRTYSQRLSR